MISPQKCQIRKQPSLLYLSLGHMNSRDQLFDVTKRILKCLVSLCKYGNFRKIIAVIEIRYTFYTYQLIYVIVNRLDHVACDISLSN